MKPKYLGDCLDFYKRWFLAGRFGVTLVFRTAEIRMTPSTPRIIGRTEAAAPAIWPASTRPSFGSIVL
jgi:hypothetical protein